MDASHPPPTVPDHRAPAVRVVDRALDWLLPFTLAGSLLFAPEWIVNAVFERRLRRGAHPLPGNACRLEMTGRLVCEAPGRPLLEVPLKQVTRVSWMVLPRVWRVRPQPGYVVRMETPALTYVIDDPPPGFTRTLQGRGVVDARATGRLHEWAALAAWWCIVGLAAWTWVPWDALAEAWRSWQADVQKP